MLRRVHTLCPVAPGLTSSAILSVGCLGEGDLAASLLPPFVSQGREGKVVFGYLCIKQLGFLQVALHSLILRPKRNIIYINLSNVI